MTDYVKVEGHEHLVRDMGSTAIVNTNRLLTLPQSKGQECTKTKR